MKRLFTLSMASMFAFAGLAHATTAYDASLASPNSTAANTTNNLSWYDGTGNQTVQGGFTVDTDSESGIEIGMRAKYRSNPTVIHSSDGIYNVLPGAQTNITSGNNGANSNRAAWNYEFSIDLRPDGVGSLTLADIVNNTTLLISDITTGHSATVNPLTYWGDDTGYGNSGGLTSVGKHTPEVAGDWGIQQSENPKFGDFPLAGFFNMNSPDLYKFTLTVADNDQQVLGSDTIYVNVVPLPAAFWSGLALLGLIGVARGAKYVRSAQLA